MKKQHLWSILSVLGYGAAFAAQEGTPTYYQTAGANTPAAYQQQGYTNYVGGSGQKQIIAQNSQTYYVPRPIEPSRGAMTINGVSAPIAEDSRTSIWADYSRRFATFEFKTGVNSILKWSDMIFNGFTVGAQHIFNLRNVDVNAYAQYSMGFLESASKSMDYDLEPYDYSKPNEGIFTISMGDSSGETSHLKFGIGAKHVWDIGGWKLSPSIGYEIFKHNLEMSNHIYPNPGVYLPLMTEDGQYVFGTGTGLGDDQYFAVNVNDAAQYGDGYFQVCMSPEDIKVVTAIDGSNLTISDWNPSPGMEYLPWGVGPGQCVIIGGDGMIEVLGTTHIYNATWSGFFIGLEIEKQMTLADKLRMYVQVGLPDYKAEGTWPKRTDWQQNPSFIDAGSSGAYSYRAEIEYTYQMSDRLQLSISADTDYFYVGEIGGELYLSEFTEWTPIEQNDGTFDWEGITYPAHTEKISDSLKYAKWQSFGLRVGVKLAF